MIIYISANIRYTQRVAIPTNAIYNTIMDPLSFIRLDISEPETICCRNYLSTHTANIPHITTNPGSGAFVGYDLRWMIMRLMAHYNTPAFSSIICCDGYHPCILFGAQDHIGASSNKLLQVGTTTFI